MTERSRAPVTSRRTILAAAVLTPLAALLSGMAIGAPADGWREVQAEFSPGHPEWPVLVAEARRRRLRPDQCAGVYETLAGPAAGCLALVLHDGGRVSALPLERA